MKNIINSEDIFNKSKLIKEIGKAESLEQLRVLAMPVIKNAYLQGKEKVKSRFEYKSSAGDFIAKNSYIIDKIIELLCQLAKPSGVAIIAVGGYGRSELFPFSDIDLLFLHKKESSETREFAQWLLYCLWDLGLNIGQAVRTIDDTVIKAKQDTTIRTNLLDSRFIAGDKKIFTQFVHEFTDYIATSSEIDFVEAKLSEREESHIRCGDSRYVLEPNIKDGKGGLRDLHNMQWLMKYTGLEGKILNDEEEKSFYIVRDFLWKVRVHLHLIANRPEERLTFDLQRAVAEAIGFRDDSNSRAVEKFMRDYFLTVRLVGGLTRSVCAGLEEHKKRKPRVNFSQLSKIGKELEEFQLDGERLAISSEEHFKESPFLLIKIFQVAHEQKLDIHPKTLQIITRNLWLIDANLRRNSNANNAFMSILLSKENPESSLRIMSESGVIGKFIPDFNKVIGQMQFDMYHVFTVDEHTIFAISILHGIGLGKYKAEMPVVTEIFHLVKSLRVLYLSIFCHDIGKGRGGDHSLIGEVIVRKLARRFGLDAYEEDLCAWLVRNHLMMSRTAFKRDLGDPKTIEDFVEKVQSPERLRLLLILTVADIRAVGPTVWNGWKGALLRELYYLSEDKMGASDKQVKKFGKDSLSMELKNLLIGWKEEEIEEYLELGDASFWSSLDAQNHVRIAHLLKELESSIMPLAIDTISDNFRSITDIILCTPDQAGLFAKMSGAIALSGASILGAKIFTLKNGIAVEMFHIQDAEHLAFDKPDKLARLSVYMNKAIVGELDVGREMAKNLSNYPSRMEVFKVPPKVYVENKSSANYTVVEVEGRDRIGFLHIITQKLAELNIGISTAHITTYGERAVDVFYVKDVFGMKIIHESKLRQIQEELVGVLSSGNK